MIVNDSLDEVKKRENALSIIKDIVENKGREFLFDLTGLSGGFIASPSELSLLETYVGPAITMKPVEPSSEGEVSYTPSFMDIYGDVLKLGFVLILIVVMLIGFMIFSRKKWGINGEKAQNQSGNHRRKESQGIHFPDVSGCYDD